MKQEQQKILIAEDDKFISEVYLTKLDSEGFQVVLAEDGKEAAEKIKKEKPSLVLLDILMPGMSGLDVLKKIKQDEELKNIPVIVLTNASEKEYASEALDLGADDYLIKSSFTPDEVVAKIKKNLAE